MRILIVSGFYPPFQLSGSELGCKHIVESLKGRGHSVSVLTSTYKFGKASTVKDIRRWLIPTSPERLYWQRVFRKELANQNLFKSLCLDFQPEVVFFFNLLGISFSLSLLAQEMGIPACFYISDDWFSTWERDEWYQVWPRGPRGAKALRYLAERYKLVPPSRPLDSPRLIFVSRYLKDAAVQVGKAKADAAVIPWGIDVRRFFPGKTNRREPSRLLYAGQIKPDRGLDAAVKALGILRNEPGRDSLTLTIAGNKRSFPLYASYLRELAGTCGVSEGVRFIGSVIPESMPDLYRDHDVFVFPAVNEEGLSISVLEAMASGLAVVGTAGGGQAEVFEDGVNALIFPREDHLACARQILRLLGERELFELVRTKARREIEERFRIEQSVEAIERELESAAKKEKSAYRGKISSAEGGGLRKSLPKIIGRVNRWLRLSTYMVLARTLLRPKFVFQKTRQVLEKTAAALALRIFPFFLETFFRLTGRRRESSAVKAGRPQNVLVVQLADVGDIILTSPFLRELRRYLPGARITLIVQPAMSPLVENCPYVDELIFFHWRAVKNWKISFHGHVRWWLQTLWMAMTRLWNRRFDLAVSLRWNNDPCLAASLILMYSSGAAHRVAYRDTPYDDRRLSWKDVNRLITQGPVRGYRGHEVERQFGLLRFLGADPVQEGLEVWTTPEDERVARELGEQSGVKPEDLIVAVAPGAAWAYRRWPVERFAELGHWMQEKYKAQLVILAAKSERELAAQLERELDPGRTINLAGKTTLRQMAAVLRHCHLFFGNDSGPMHVATAVGVPVVVLFGSGEYERFRPWGLEHEIVRLGLTCSPCSENCWFEEARCIRGISVKQVEIALAKKLDLIQRNREKNP